MKKQLQGISLLLFGMIWMMFSIIAPWIPIIEGVLSELAPFIGMGFGIIGLIFSFSKEKE